MATMTFHSWRRSKVLAAAVRDGGRLKGSLQLDLEDTSTGQKLTDAVPVLFTSAAEVSGLKQGAIRHLAPKPSTSDAETTKFVHVDFTEPDLPWRYSPRPAAAGTPQLFPWLVLLVGVAEELKTADGIVTVVESNVLKDHDLTTSHLWAHVQEEGAVTFSRLISPYKLRPQREHVAALVPSFDQNGEFLWTGGDKNFDVLPTFFSWHFWTAEEGDFETLATALQLRKAGDLGKARLRYHRPLTNVDVTLEARGAITSLQPPTAQTEEVAKARADLDFLNNSITDEVPPGVLPPPPLRKIIQLPQYGGLWLEDIDAAKWSKSLNDDARHRGIAGLGLWMGIVEQESLMEAAVLQAGALQDAGQRIGHLALGLAAAAGLWTRRLPDTPELQLRIFGPAMGRMLADGGDTVLNRVTSETSTLDAAVFSSAAQRLLRNGSCRSRFAANGRIDRKAVMTAANESPLPLAKTPEGLPHVDTVAEGLGERPLEEALGLPRFDERLDQILEKFDGQPNEPQIVADFARLVDEELGLTCRDLIAQFITTIIQPQPTVLERDILMAAIEHCLSQGLPGLVRESGLQSALPRSGTRDPRRPINLAVLADIVAKAIDPTQAKPPAWLRVSSTIKGLDLKTLAPPEAPIGLDYPTWTLVNKHEKEWLLPGCGTLPNHSIVALQTNPTFVDAFMVGINTQFLGEMRWRNLPAPRVSTPLRMFWGYVNHDKGVREADIRPIGDWPSKPEGAASADDVGDLSHQAIKPGDTTGKKDLVIAFRTPLFRRYPSTLVYLVRPLAGDNADDILKAPPNFKDSPTDRTQRRYFGPIFFGQMEPDLVFFAFDIDPQTLDEFWLVLDEPPSELRFRNDKGVNWPNSAKFAERTIDHPTRIAISGKELEAQANNP